MPLIKVALDEEIPLNLPTDEDPSQEAFVRVRAVTQRENERWSQFGAQQKRSYDDDGRKFVVESDFNYEARKRLECYLAISGTNVEMPDPNDETKSKPVFVFRKEHGKMVISMTEAEFAAAYGAMPQIWADAMHKAVLKKNPHWNPNLPA